MPNINPYLGQHASRFAEKSKWFVTHLLLVIVTGALMGLIGSALAEASHHPQCGNTLSGALGASWTFGIEFLLRPVNSAKK